MSTSSTSKARALAGTTHAEAVRAGAHQPATAGAENGRPAEVDRLFAEAADLFARNKYKDAERTCRACLECHPRHAESLHMLGVLAYRAREYGQAVCLLRRATALSRHSAHYHSNLGGALQALGQLDQAAVRYRRAVALRPQFAEAHFNLGNLLRSQGRQFEAIEAYGRAIAAEPRLHQAHTNLGNLLQTIGEWSGADACYEEALAIRPDSAEAYSNLGNLRRAEGRLNEAIVHYRKALSCDPDFADACTNLGTVLHQQGLLDEAIGWQEKALQLRPDLAEAHHNLGCALQAKGQTDAAFECYRRAIALKPHYANAHFGQALIHLLRADYEHGWPGYEWRWKSDQHSTRWRKTDQPVWQGERLPSGQLLLWGEQGVGDEILFAGLVPEAVATGNDCVLECDPRLVPLFSRSFPLVKVAPSFSTDQVDVAAHLPSGSLPGLFRRNAAQFSAGRRSYLSPDPIGVARFRALYQDGRRVIGLAWHTKNAKSGFRRSIDLSLLALLFTRTDVRWVSLQYGDHDSIQEETAAVGAPMLIDRSVDQLLNIDTFAAQVAAMDLVITIDNSTAHLAGALGVPVWVLLPFAPDWRWLEERPDCPWYPSVRLFRQPCYGDWKSVIQYVDQQLDGMEHAGIARALHASERNLAEQHSSFAST